MITFKNLVAECRALGRTCRRADGEIRVGFPRNESAAYYTNCHGDALATARLMAKAAAPVADMVTDCDGCEHEIEALEVLGTVNGVTYYECPAQGDEAPLQIIEAGRLVDSDFWDMDSARGA